MTALSVQPPFPIITGLDGQPLEDGYIWIGVANLSPIPNPIAVYWDAGLTIPAPLPIRTQGGYPVNSGTPARLYVGSDYSIQVQDKNGSVAYTSLFNNGPLAGGFISSANVTFLQAGTGAVTRTAQSKMRDFVSVKDFGAVGNGVADDTVAIQAALDSGNLTIWFPQGSYLTSATLSPVSNQMLTGFGATITTTNGNYYDAITINGKTNVVISDIAIEGPAGGDGFDIAIRIQDSVNVTIRGVIINNIGRSVAMPNEKGFGILIQSATNIAPVSGVNGCFNINIIDNTITNIKGFGDFRGDGVLLRNALGVVISRNTIGNVKRMGIAVTDYATQIQIVDNEIYDISLAGIDIEPDTVPSPTGEIIIANNTIRNFGIKPVTHVGVQFYGIDLHSGEFENIVVEGNIITAETAQASAGINAQNNARNATIDGNIIHGNNFIEYGILLYAGNGFENLIISNNIIRGFTTHGIDAYSNEQLVINANLISTATCTTAIKINEVEKAVSIIGNIIDITTSCTNAIELALTEETIISGNGITVASGNGITCTTSINNAAATISANTIRGTSSMANGILLFTSVGYEHVTISNNTIKNFTDYGIRAFQSEQVTLTANVFVTATCTSAIYLNEVLNSASVVANVVLITTSCTAAIQVDLNKKTSISSNLVTTASGDGISLRVSVAGNYYAVLTGNAYEKTGATGGSAIAVLGNIGRLFITRGGNLSINATNEFSITGSVTDQTWPPIVPIFTAANIASIANDVNTSGKYAGKQVWDSTNNRMMRANGAAAGDVWYIIDGSASVTPT